MNYTALDLYKPSEQRDLADSGAAFGSACKKCRARAFTLTEVMIVVAIIGLLLAIAIPNFVRARVRSRATICSTNLKRIHWAKCQWALDNRKKNTDTPTEAQLDPYFNDGKTPTCPAGGTYQIKEVEDVPRCSLREEGHELKGTPPDHATATGYN